MSDIETVKTEVVKVELYIIDHDGCGADEIKSVLENARYPNRCISPNVVSTESKTIEYHDQHPINLISEREKAYKGLFSNSCLNNNGAIASLEKFSISEDEWEWVVKVNGASVAGYYYDSKSDAEALVDEINGNLIEPPKEGEQA